MNRLLAALIAAIAFCGCSPTLPSWSPRWQRPGRITCFTPQGSVLFSGEVEHASHTNKGNFWTVFVNKDRIIKTNATCMHEIDMSLVKSEETGEQE